MGILSRSTRSKLIATSFLLLLYSHYGHAEGQLGKAIAHDSQIDSSKNKYLQREAHNDDGSTTRPLDEFADITCPQDIAIRWHTEMTSGIYATPLITDLFSDGRKDIIVPGFHGNVFVVDGQTGTADQTFESPYHLSTLHVSPLLYDIDFDGVLDIIVPSYDGEIQFFKDTGEEASYPISVPRLRVRSDWFKGLKPDPTDHSNPDISSSRDDSGIGERRAGVESVGVKRRSLLGMWNSGNHSTGTLRGTRRSLLQADIGNNNGDQHQQTVTQPNQITDEAAESFTELFGEDTGNENDLEHRLTAEEDAAFIDEDLAHELEYSETDEDYYHHFDDHGKDIAEERRHGHVTHDDRGDGSQHGGTVSYKEDADYSDIEISLPQGQHKGDLWVEESKAFSEVYDKDGRPLNPDVLRDRMRNRAPPIPYIYVDAHILSTPAIADIDGDGREELVVAVSYFYDPAVYAANTGRTQILLGPNGDPSKYVASGVIVFDLSTRSMKWSQHLDLSTSATRYKAMIYGSPTLADVNNDGKLEVIVGTSMGFLYVLNAMTGNVLDGWPLQMGDIQGQVAVADINDDGVLELLAGDARGSVVALRPDGTELWERHISTGIGGGITLGDVDGDGVLEAVFGTFDGRIYVLDGRSGADKDGFPFRTYGRIVTPITLTKLDDPKSKGMQMAVVSHDGFLYVIDGISACADTLDLGEPSYSMVLVEDVAHSGNLDLLVATAGGHLYAIRTAAKYQPLKVWPAQTPGTSSAGFVSRWDWEGIYATATSRVPRDVRGESVAIRLTIVDKRPLPAGKSQHGPYKVSVSLQGVGVKEMNRGDAPVIGMSQLINKTGSFSMEVPCPKTRTSATIKITMKDEAGTVFTDEFALSFHIHFYRLLKWLLVGPFAFTVLAALLVHGASIAREELPS